MRKNNLIFQLICDFSKYCPDGFVVLIADLNSSAQVTLFYIFNKHEKYSKNKKGDLAHNILVIFPFVLPYFSCFKCFKTSCTRWRMSFSFQRHVRFTSTCTVPAAQWSPQSCCRSTKLLCTKQLNWACTTTYLRRGCGHTKLYEFV